MKQCTTCEITFRTGHGLRQHQAIRHGELVTHRCRVCEVPFTCRTDLDRHMAAERHYRSAKLLETGTQPKATATTSTTSRPKLRSVIAIPSRPSSSLPTSQLTEADSRRRELNSFTIPKKRSCVPERPVYSGKSRDAELDEVEKEIARLERQVRRLTKPKSKAAKAESKDTSSAKANSKNASSAKAELLEDPQWEAYVEEQAERQD